MSEDRHLVAEHSAAGSRAGLGFAEESRDYVNHLAEVWTDTAER